MNTLIANKGTMARYFVMATDFIALNVMTLLFHYTHFCRLPRPWSESGKYLFLLMNLIYFVVVVAVPPVLQQRNVRVETIVGRVFRTVVIFNVSLFCALHFINETPPNGLVWWPTFFSGCLVVLLCSRLSLHYTIRAYRRRGRNTRQVLFVGCSQNMMDLGQALFADLGHGYRIRGYFDDFPREKFTEKIPFLGKVPDVLPYLQSMQQTARIDELYCSLPSSCAESIRAIIHYCENNMIRFYSVPNVRNYLRRQMNMKLVGDVPVLYIHEEPLSRTENRIIKRTFDVVVSLLFLLLVFPWIFLFVFVVMKLTMPGPIFFRQRRNGENGKVFTCYKFRSMKANREADTVQATKDDPRKTRFGELMRHLNIDELPQFFNVLRGDMSIVGPRPHMLMHTQQYSALIDEYMMRHMAKPGITGWAQTHGLRGETKELWQMRARVEADVWYIENWTFWLDLRIIYLTVRNIFRGEKEAY